MSHYTNTTNTETYGEGGGVALNILNKDLAYQGGLSYEIWLYLYIRVCYGKNCQRKTTAESPMHISVCHQIC